MTTDDTASQSPSRLIHLTLDAASIGRNSPDVEHEREVAICDLLESNHFALVDKAPGPYSLIIALVDRKLAFNISSENGTELAIFMLSLSPFKRVIKDYFMICESYFDAIKTAPPSRIEAIDMGRRGLHDEGSRLLMTRLDGKIELDFDTARRLFTLICALHWRG